MQDFSIFLDGSPVPAIEFSGTAGTRVTVEQKDGETAISYANELTFYGQSRDYILNKLVSGANPQMDYIEVSIYDNCCTNADGNAILVFAGRATRADIEFCEPNYNEDCGVTCTLSDASVASDKIQCIRNVLITQRRYDGFTSEGEDTFRSSVEFGYYEETRPRSYTAILIYLIFIVLTLYLPIVAVFTLLTLGFVDTSFLYNSLLDILLKKKFHKAPFIHSYLSNVCKLCRITLRSSIFGVGGAYHNLTRLDTPLQEGEAFFTGGTADQIYRNFNSPNITLAELMRSFKELNIIYIVTDTELIVERSDYFGNNVWIDFTQRTGDLLLSPCFTPNDESQPAIEVFKYAEDGSDKLGNESNRLWSGDPVDYNTPIAPSLRGVRQTTIPYGSARFLVDGLPSVINKLLTSNYARFITFGNIQLTTGSLLMTTGTSSIPKLLMYDGISPMYDAQVEVLNRTYNGRVWLRNNMQQQYGVNNFYNELLTINDPRLNLRRNLNYSLRFSYNCEDLRTRNFGQVAIIPFLGQAVTARIDNIEIDFEAREITISGVI